MFEIIMNKYRGQVSIMMKASGTRKAISLANTKSSKIYIAESKLNQNLSYGIIFPYKRRMLVFSDCKP